MDVDTVFTLVIFTFLLILMVQVVRIFKINRIGVKIIEKRCSELQIKIDLEKEKNKANQYLIEHVEQYSETLIDRLFVIIKDILFTQKLIFENEDK